MNCPKCNTPMYQSMGGTEICPRCGYGSSSFEVAQKQKEQLRQKSSPTIVGGRPPDSAKTIREIPHGLDIVIKKAAVDKSFRQRLLQKRAEVAREIDLDLLPAEMAMLNNAPAEQLETIIKSTTIPETQRNIFLGNDVLTMRAVIAETCQCVACRQLNEGGWMLTKGIRPDVTRGIDFDVPPNVREDHER